jgi:hypothetical protein
MIRSQTVTNYKSAIDSSIEYTIDRYHLQIIYDAQAIIDTPVRAGARYST